jgi:hypothetical protein
MADVGAIIEKSGCGEVSRMPSTSPWIHYLAQLNDLYCDVCVCGGNQSYYALEECLGENKRDFRACRKEMEALKKCSDSKNLVRHPLETT